jgi:hypothetical protein
MPRSNSRVISLSPATGLPARSGGKGTGSIPVPLSHPCMIAPTRSWVGAPGATTGEEGGALVSGGLPAGYGLASEGRTDSPPPSTPFGTESDRTRHTADFSTG